VWKKYLFKGAIFLFSLYLKTKFFWAQQNLRGGTAWNARHCYGPENTTQHCFKLQASFCLFSFALFSVFAPTCNRHGANKECIKEREICDGDKKAYGGANAKQA